MICLLGMLSLLEVFDVLQLRSHGLCSSLPREGRGRERETERERERDPSKVVLPSRSSGRDTANYCQLPPITAVP